MYRTCYLALLYYTFFLYVFVIGALWLVLPYERTIFLHTSVIHGLGYGVVSEF